MTEVTRVATIYLRRHTQATELTDELASAAYDSIMAHKGVDVSKSTGNSGERVGYIIPYHAISEAVFSKTVTHPDAPEDANCGGE